MEKGFFVDKDGTLVDNSGYPEVIPSDGLLVDDVIEGLKHINGLGYKIIIISNQPWIAKGRLTHNEVEDYFVSLINKLSEHGVVVADYVFCPHQISDSCDCKKPSPKMIFESAKKHDINLSESYIVGDMDADILAGKNAGVKTVLVMTGSGSGYLDSEDINPDYVIENLNAIKGLITS